MVKQRKCVVPPCSFPECEKFHTFPNDPELFKKWLTLIGRYDLLEMPMKAIRCKYRICDAHFSDKQKYPGSRNPTNLKKTSVPDIGITPISVESVAPALQETSSAFVCDPATASATSSSVPFTADETFLPHGRDSGDVSSSSQCASLVPEERRLLGTCDTDSCNDPERKRKKMEEPEKPMDLKKSQSAESQNDEDVKCQKMEQPKKLVLSGAYIPPAKLRMMRDNITDKSSVAFQQLAWEALKKSIHGLINKVNTSNIGIIVRDLLRENIVRGRGLLCRSLIQAQSASPKFTNVYAALVAVINSKFPNVGELIITRCIIQFKRSFRRNDKTACISASTFIAHLVNQRVLHEIVALQILMLLVEKPTDDSVEVAIALLKECGEKLCEVSPKGVNSIFDTLRGILHDGKLDKRVQYMIEVMFQIRKDKFKDHPALPPELDLIEEGDQFIHMMLLTDPVDAQDMLNVFKHDPDYEENENKYKALCREILGSDDEASDAGETDDESEDDDSENETTQEKAELIRDETETNLVAFRRTIYLTINSSLDYQECAHKLLKIQMKPGQELELCHMFLDCCTQQRTYEKFFGLLAQRFCEINRTYVEPLKQIFEDSYHTIHRLDTNRLRNVAKFFAHLLYSDALPWTILSIIRLNEEDTTSSSRIFIKILFQELCEFMGLTNLRNRIVDPSLEEAFAGLFPRDNPKNARFSINFFTSIGLGGLTDQIRDILVADWTVDYS